MADFFDGKVGGSSRSRNNGKKNQKEDKATFVARTGAQREARAHSKAQEVAASKITALFRRTRDWSNKKSLILASLGSRFEDASSGSWKEMDRYFSSFFFAVQDGANTPEGFKEALNLILKCLTEGHGDYLARGLDTNSATLSLHIRRMAGQVVSVLAAEGWGILPVVKPRDTGDPRRSEAEIPEILKSLFILTHPSQWKGIPKQYVDRANTIAASVLHYLVLSHQLYKKLREVVESPLLEKRPEAERTLFWTLILRPLSASQESNPPPKTDGQVAFSFSKQILSISQVYRKVAKMLRPSLLHHTLWPRVVFALGTAADAESGGRRPGRRLPEPDLENEPLRINETIGNLVEITVQRHETFGLLDLPGLQILYLSALHKQLEALGSDSSWIPNSPHLKQCGGLHSIKHIHWLLLGLGGSSSGASGAAQPASSGLGRKQSTDLTTLSYKDWMKSMEDCRKVLNKDGKPKHTEPISYFCSIYGKLLRIWPAATVQLLNALAFDSPVHIMLWVWLRQSGVLQSYIDDGAEAGLVGDVMFLFCKCYLHRLMVTDDVEFYEKQIPFPLPQLVEMALMLRQYVNRRFWGGETRSIGASAKGDGTAAVRQLHREAATQLMHQLYDRNTRKEFCPLDTWLQKGLKMDAFGIKSRGEESQTLLILEEFPHVIPLADRVRIFHRLIQEDRASQEEGEVGVRIRRGKLVSDAFAALGPLRSHLKRTVKVHFVNEGGVDESGIDMGGLYKEFLTSFIQLAFSPDYGLFKFSEDRQLYPNPNSHLVPDHLLLFAFLGRMVGKAMYDGIQVDLPFCPFFLSKLLGKHNYLDELPSLDKALHRNLMYLKNYDGPVADLSLFFSVQAEEEGAGEERELIAGGREVAVTEENRLQFVLLVADFRLNQQIKAQSSAFLQGFQDLIPLSSLRFFNPSELQILISGENGGDFSVEDLRRHTVYSGGYSDSDSVCKRFWKVVAEFSPEQKSLLLKFVTSCPRPPLLGFGSLHPPFCIHKVRSDRSFFDHLARKEEERLPTASTCMNLLKLPPYSSSSALRKKLEYAISACAGFELS